MKRIILILLAAVICGSVLSSCGNKFKAKPLLPISEKALRDTSSVYYADFQNYPTETSQLPIGIFDSGIGGLTVLETLLSIDKFDNITGALSSDGIADFAGENFMYFSDYANMPYGDFLRDGRDDELREITVKDALFLMDSKYYNVAEDDIRTGIKEPVKIIVVACNTASACGYSDVDTLLRLSGTGVKVVGVINSGVRASLEGLNPDAENAVGVLSSPGAVSSSEYDSAIRDEAARKGMQKMLQIFIHEADGMSEAIDGVPGYIDPSATEPRSDYAGPVIGEGENNIDLNLMDRYNFDFSGNAMLYRMEHGKYTELQLNSPGNYARFHLVSLIEKHRRSGSRIPISSVILGSTHYPFVQDTLVKVKNELYNFRRDGMYLYKNSIDRNFHFINPAEYTAEECYDILRNSGEMALRTVKSELQAFISVPAGKDTTDEITTKVVPFSPRYMESDALPRMESLVPYSYSLLKQYLY